MSHPPIGVIQPDGVQRVTDASEVQKVGLPPLNTESKASLQRILYCKQYALDQDNRYLITNEVWGGYTALWDMTSLRFVRSLPATKENGITLANNPVWDPNNPGCLIYQYGGAVYRQRFDDPDSRVLLASPLKDMVFISNGGEGDMDAKGRYYAVKMAASFNPQGQPQGVKCGVVDVVNKKLLIGTIPGNPNALDISPSGEWLAYLDHQDLASNKPNRFYRISDLAAGDTSKPVALPSNSKWSNDYNGPTQSMGHSGWAGGTSDIFVYQENFVEDVICAFTISTGVTRKLFYHGPMDPTGKPTFWGGYIGTHFARTGPVGFVVLSAYDTPGSAKDGVYLVNASTGEIKLSFLSHNIHRDYESEGFAGVTRDGKFAYWSANYGGNGADWHVEVYRGALTADAALPPNPRPPVNPIPVPPNPTPDPTPPAEVPIYRIEGTYGGLPVSLKVFAGAKP